MASFKPEGFTAITPYLIVEDGEGMLWFLITAFDAKEMSVNRDDNGRIMHAEMRLGDGVVEFGQAGETWSAFPASVHFYVPDVDAVHARALGAGAKELDPPKDQSYGERSSAIKDPAGNQWFIATLLASGD